MSSKHRVQDQYCTV